MTSALPNSAALDRPQSTALPAIETLHTLYAPRIFRFLLASTRDRDLAETLTQETFLRAWSARDQYRGDASPITWLTRIALNLLRDHTRTERFRFWRRAASSAVDAQSLAAHLPHPTPLADAALIAHQQLAGLWQSLTALSNRQRTIFLLRYIDQHELHEIAEITNLSLPTVKTHLYRALAIVRTQAARTPQDSK